MIVSLASPLLPASPFLRSCNPLPFSTLRVLEWKRTKKITEDGQVSSRNLSLSSCRACSSLAVSFAVWIQKPLAFWTQGGRRGTGTCRAELAHDAPFALAIGACVLNSLVFPVPSGPDDDGGSGSGSGIDSTDMRFAVMGVVSFIPYFNWMSWVFAWLDSGRQRYIVYSIVYLAPYLRTNLSLSPEESWLPVASIFFCILHIQLEASIRNGDLNSTQLFNETLKLLFPVNRKKDAHFQGHQGLPKEGRKKEHVKLPSAQEESRKKRRDWEVSGEQVDDLRHFNENGDVNEKREKSD